MSFRRGHTRIRNGREETVRPTTVKDRGGAPVATVNTDTTSAVTGAVSADPMAAPATRPHHLSTPENPHPEVAEGATAVVVEKDQGFVFVVREPEEHERLLGAVNSYLDPEDSQGRADAEKVLSEHPDKKLFELVQYVERVEYPDNKPAIAAALDADAQITASKLKWAKQGELIADAPMSRDEREHVDTQIDAWHHQTNSIKWLTTDEEGYHSPALQLSSHLSFPRKDR